MSAQDSTKPVIDRATTDLSLMARVSGGLYVSGSVLVLVSLALPHSNSTEVVPLLGVAAVALLFGALLHQFCELVEVWMIDVLLATASVLVSLSVLFSGVAAGVYSTMFVWVVIVAACTASRAGLAVHIAWLLVVYGSVLIALDDRTADVSAVTRFVLAGFALIAVGAAVSWLVEGRRNAEAGLHREIESRKQLQGELEHLANHDPLTGVANRRHLDRHLTAALADADRTKAPLCLIALDIDGFKEFNDRRGHAAGDRLLKSSVSAWNNVHRSGDAITRMGGDEFLVVLPDCPLDVTKQVAARLRDAVPEGQSCSTGISCWNGEDSAEQLVHAADAAMYRTKDARSTLAT